MITQKKRGRGRPGTGKGTLIGVRLQPAPLAQLTDGQPLSRTSDRALKLSGDC